MEAIRGLEGEGYSISLIGNDIRCQKKERANPDPVKVGHLLTALKEKKGEAIEYLKKRFCYDRHLEDAIERLNHLGARCMAEKGLMIWKSSLPWQQTAAILRNL